MENSKSIVERIDKSEKMKIIKVMRKKSFLNYRDDLEKLGMKVDFATSPFSYYKITHRKWGSDSIYITSKKNVGSDAEYISNDNIAMGELTEIVQETMFNKMKAKEQLKELVREVVADIVTENHEFKVGDEVKFNGNYDGVVVKVHTSGKLKGMIDVQKKGRSSTVTLSASNKKKFVSEKQSTIMKEQTSTPTYYHQVKFNLQLEQSISLVQDHIQWQMPRDSSISRLSILPTSSQKIKASYQEMQKSIWQIC